MVKDSFKNKALFILLFFTLSSSIIFQTAESKINNDPIEDLSLNYVVSDAIGIVDDIQLANYSSSGNGTEGNPYIIENLKIQTEEETGIFVGHTTKHFIIRDCLVDAFNRAIFLYNITVGTARISNNTCTNVQGGYGILVIEADNVVVSDNICRNNYYGIIVDFCEGAIVINNECGFNDEPLGIYNSPNVYVFNNTAMYGDETGISIYQCNNLICENNTIFDVGSNDYYNTNGLVVSYSTNVTIRYNTIDETGQGIYLFAITESEIYQNVIMRCSSYGMQLNWNSFDWPTENNTIHHNFFIGNSWVFYPWVEFDTQAFDRGVRNEMWYDNNTNVGNYWTDHLGPGSYLLEGGEGYEDPYPMVADDTDADGLDDIQETYIYFTNVNNNDTDSDMLLDGEEAFDYFCNPLLKDTDYDGLEDGVEVLIYNTNPTTQDTDADGLKDGEEVLTHGTNPRRADSDFDSMPDGWEVIFGLDPLLNDSFEDPDTDGLLNLEEYQESTQPLNNDTDDDLLLDGDEVHTYFCSPLNNDTDDDGLMDGVEVHVYGCNPDAKDTDGDKLKDGAEIFVHLTSPTDSDSDDDGCDDGWEVRYKFDPLDSSDGNDDPDNDGLTNTEEYLYGTSPKNWDTDEDDFSDGLEVRKGTDPLLITDHPMSPEDVTKMAVGISIGSAAAVGLVLYILAKKKIISFKK